MDIHRCRFVPYPASTINVVAFSTPTASNKAAPVRLAIGRADGSLEIWNPRHGVWLQELVIPGGEGRSIDGLVWTTEPDEEYDGQTISGKLRLFSIGYTQTVTEWDLEKARAKRHAGGQHGDIWCIAAQPLPSKGSQGTSRKLVAGTVDGCLVLYATEDDDLRMQRIIVRTPSKKVKMVSATFQSRNVVIVGCSDSTLRAYDIRHGSVLAQMTLGSDLSGGTKDIIVWAVKCLENGDIVSGDSTGQVCIWDGRTYTQAQRIQSHTQDVLSLAASADGKKIISGGMDRRTILYEPMSGPSGRWTKVWHRRYHKHDVKTLASFEGQGISVVVSGGPDATPVVFPLRGAGREHHRTLSHLPQNTPVLGAPKARFVVSWWAREIHIWRLLYPPAELMKSATSDISKNHRLLGKVLIKGEANIASAAISRDGSLLVVSTLSDVKAFQLRLGGRPSKAKLAIKKATVDEPVEGVTKVEISPDAQWVCLTREGSRVLVAKVSSTSTADGVSYRIERFKRLQRLRRDIPKHIALGGLGAYDRTVTQTAFSPDSKMLATCDLAGYIDTWILRCQSQTNGVNGADDDNKSSTSSDDSDEELEGDSGWIRNPKASLMPKLPSAPVALSFSRDIPGVQEESDDYKLLVVTASFRIYLFDPLRGAFSDWSRRNPFAKLPQKLQVTKDVVKGVIWQGSRAWLYGVSFLFMLDLSQDLEREKAVDSAKGEAKGTKRKREDQGSGAGDKMKKHALAPQKVKIVTDAGGTGTWMDVDLADGDEQQIDGVDEGQDEDEEDTDGGELQSMRDAEGTKKDDAKRPGWWHTYKYRPILGIVPLHSGDVDGLALEVVLVERPLWDVDLPDRYFADGETER